MKKTLNIVKLYFTEPLALMSEKKDEFQKEVVSYPSDTLKGALVSGLAWGLRDKDMASLNRKTEKFNENLRVSAAYLFYEDRKQNKSYYFFPKPMTRLPVKPTGKPGESKRIKKIQFIEKSLFEKILKAETFPLDDSQTLHNGKIIVSDKSVFREKVKLYASETYGRVKIGNVNVLGDGEKGSPFYVSRTFFYHKKDKETDGVAGLYFIFEAADEETMTMLDIALKVLEDEGLGADRRLGNGRFSYRMSTMELNIPDQADRQMILSKYIPTQEEIKGKVLENASYNLTKRGGYVSGTLQENFAHYSKRNIYTIDEASVFDIEHTLAGKYVDLLDEKNRKEIGHPVWREGRPLSIALKESGNQEQQNNCEN